MARIVLKEETLDTSYLPPSLPHREKELAVLKDRYARALQVGSGYHQLITGSVGSGKTALARRLGQELKRLPRARDATPLHDLYVNCWRRNSDRTVLLDLLRGVGVSLPDRGYSLSEMLDVFEQGIRKEPRHLLIVLDEVTSLLKTETRLVYLLSRAREVGLGSLSLLLIAPQDPLPYLDPASRSSFGVTHQLHLPKYSATQLADIVELRAKLALKPGSVSREVAEQVASVAAPAGDARLALEIPAGAARREEGRDCQEVEPEDVRWSKASLYPTVTEERLEELPHASLFVLLALARTLKTPGTWATTERVRSAYQTVTEEFGMKPQSRVTFWRTVKDLERAGLVEMEKTRPGQPARITQNELPASYLELVLQERLGRARSPRGSR